MRQASKAHVLNIETFFSFFFLKTEVKTVDGFVCLSECMTPKLGGRLLSLASERRNYAQSKDNSQLKKRQRD